MRNDIARKVALGSVLAGALLMSWGSIAAFAVTNCVMTATGSAQPTCAGDNCPVNNPGCSGTFVVIIRYDEHGDPYVADVEGRCMCVDTTPPSGPVVTPPGGVDCKMVAHWHQYPPQTLPYKYTCEEGTCAESCEPDAVWCPT